MLIAAGPAVLSDPSDHSSSAPGTLITAAATAVAAASNSDGWRAVEPEKPPLRTSARNWPKPLVNGFKPTTAP